MKHLIIFLLFPFLAAAQPIISSIDVIKPYGDFQSPLTFELPLKILIYEEGKTVNIHYEKVASIAEKYHIKQNFSTAEKIDAVMLQLIKSSIGN